MTFKKITGNYVELVNKLGLSNSFYKNSGKDKYQEDLKKDISRLAGMINFRSSLKELQESLLDISHLENVFSYTQGDFTASSLSPSYFMENFYVNNHGENIVEAAVMRGEDSPMDYIGMCYRNNTGVNYGITISYIRDDSNLEIPEENRPRPLTVTIIKNPNLAPENRTVTYLSDTSLLNAATMAHAEDLASDNVLYEVATAIGSPESPDTHKLMTLLGGVIVNDRLSITGFRELKNRLSSAHNLDNRDEKKVQFAALVAQLNQKFPDNTISAYYENLSLTDVDFFKDSMFENHCIKAQINAHNEHSSKLLILRLAQENNSADKSSFYKQASNVLKNLKPILDKDRSPNNQEKLTLVELEQINTIARCISGLLENPKNAELLYELDDVSKTISGQGSPLWQALGAALIAFTAIALIVAGVVGAIPTGGASLLATAAGAAVLTGTGAAGIVKGSQSALCQSVGLFKQATEKVPGNAGENNGAEEQKGPVL